LIHEEEYVRPAAGIQDELGLRVLFANTYAKRHGLRAWLRSVSSGAGLPGYTRSSGFGRGHDGGLTVQELADELQADFLPALMWLTAGVVVEYGNGDVRWLHRGGDNDGPDVVEG
jgi:hypothetical protein